MNAMRRFLPRMPVMRETLRSCLFLGMLVVNLAVIAAIALHVRDPRHMALGATALSMLLAALP